MAEQTIDKISIEIKTRADESVKSIENLTLALAELQDYATPTATGLSNIKKSLVDMNKPLSTMNKNYLSSARNIGKFSQSLNDLSSKMANIQTGGFNKLVKGMRELSRISEYTKVFTEVKKDLNDFNRGIKTLEKTTTLLPKIVKSFKELDISPMVSNFSRLTSIMRPFNQAMGNASAVIKLFGTSLRVLPSDIERLNKKVSSLTQNTEKMGGAINRIASIQSLRMGYDVISRLTDGIMGFVNRSMDYTETINLFNVAMGGYAETAEKFINQLNNLGIDPAEATKMQGLFFQISESLGLTSEKAYILSENFTKLTYDLASFFNIGTQEAFEKLRAGLVGETEPLRQLGIVITENNLAETARRLGIEQSIRTMTEAQKIELRYVTALYQSANAHNDLERTILSPANAMRILQAEFGQTARAIGDVFIPILIKVLPYITAFVRLIGQAVSALASFFGFEMPKIENSVGNSFGGLSDTLQPSVEGTENMGKNLDSATKSAKELRRQLMGFDELNVLTSPTPSAGVGGGGGGGGIGGIGGMLDDLLSLEDFLSAGYDQLFLDVTDSVQKFIDKIKDLAKRWIPILAGALAGLLALKIYDWFEDLGDESDRTGTKLKGFSKITDALKNPIGTLKGLLGNKKVGLIGAVSLLAYNLTDVLLNSDGFQKTLGFLADGVKNLVDKIPPLNLNFDTLNTEFADIGLSGSTVITLLGGLGMALLGIPFAPVVAGGGALIGVMEIFGKSIQNPVDELDIFKTGLSDTTVQAVQPFAQSLRDLDTDMQLINFDGIITEEEIASLQSKLTGITDTILNSLNADRNLELQNLDTLKHFMSDEEYEKAVERINTRYDGMIAEIEGKNEAMLTIIRDFQEGRISEEVMYEKLRNEVLKPIWEQGLTTFSESQVEMEKIKRRVSENIGAIDLQSAQELLERAKTLRDDIITTENDKWEERLAIVSLNWQNMTAEEQKFMKDILTKEHKAYKDRIRQANDEYYLLGKEIEKGLGENAKYIDIENAKLLNEIEAYNKSRVTKEEETQTKINNTVNTAHQKLTGSTNTFHNDMNTLNKKFGGSMVQDYDGNFRQVSASFDGNYKTIMNENDKGLDKLSSSNKTGLGKYTSTFKNNFKDEITPQFESSKYSTLGTNASNGIYNGARSGLINNKWNLQDLIKINFTDVFRSEINKVNNMKVNVPTPSGKSKSLSAFKIPTFARGGMPSIGSLFVAGEMGSELIGKFGGRDTVMPLEDSGFVDAMYDAVFQAVSTAFTTLDSGDVILQVGEEELGRSAISGINRITNKIGHTLLKI